MNSTANPVKLSYRDVGLNKEQYKLSKPSIQMTKNIKYK